MGILQSFRLIAASTALTAAVGISAAAGGSGAKPVPAPVPYVPSATPGVFVRHIPSASPSGAARQVYLKPGESIPAGSLPLRAKSRDTKYTQSFAGPHGTTILFVDPAQAIYETARVTPTGGLKRNCGRLPAVRTARPSASPHATPASAKGAGQ